MRSKQDIGTRTDGLSNTFAKLNGAGDITQCRLMSAPQRIGSSGIKFHRRKPLVKHVLGAFGSHLGIIPEGVDVVMGKRIKIAVGADPLIHESTQKRVHRPIVRLAQDIPAGNLEA